MFSRKNRLPMAETRKKPVVTMGTPVFSIKIFDSSREYNRFAIIIGKNVSKKSAERHRIKRRIAALAGKWPDYGKDFLFIVHPGAAREDFRGLKGQIDKARAKIEN